MSVKKLNDGVLFPLFKPKISWYPTVMFVYFAVSFFPVVKFAGGDSNPSNECSRRDAGLPGPVIYKINYGIPSVMGNPGRL
jgi:hypothetical protein